ncbi:MAG: 3',5'-cyclic-nucleotide phosphodiesterase [Thiobacillus sp.]|nr:3',5'-cyclic-nucleotide phosphodiesterase [Gammaproteobacteria bacterium]MDP1924333.1 3',5'-cyclic-nucleotide phosphodiesterase [Thiobacillus sp.]MDP3125158.1 3',5'-cyclic-nucleotide phosphodiesterase [Thiobacillus sp.]
MKFSILGCSGGIGDGRQTTSFLVDDDILVDAGTGITTLGFEQLLAIDHVFITHSHLDHVLGLPLLLDVVGEKRSAPVVVHALPEVLDILAADLFNWRLWPDFREIPSIDAPWLRFEPLPLGATCTLGQRSFIPLPVQHVVPACGLQIRTPAGSLVFSGDTTHSDAFVAALNAIPDLRHLIVETSFENAFAGIARESQHHWPDSLAVELAGLSVHPEVWITHLKPGNEAAIMDELRAAAPDWKLTALQQGQVIRLD